MKLSAQTLRQPGREWVDAPVNDYVLSALKKRGIGAERYKFVGHTEELRQTLVDKKDAYLRSYPTPGGRVYLEITKLGIVPVVPRPQDLGPFAPSSFRSQKHGLKLAALQRRSTPIGPVDHETISPILCL